MKKFTLSILHNSSFIFSRCHLCVLCGLLLICLSGCGHVISHELRQQAEKGITPEVLFKDPDALKGKTVILGGIIVSSKNTNEGTYIEVLQKPLDYRGRPKVTDITYGRFLIFSESYLDTAVYSAGREIAVAGEILGRQIRPLGEIQYSYLLIKGKELHLIEPHEGLPIRFSIGIWKTF